MIVVITGENKIHKELGDFQKDSNPRAKFLQDIGELLMRKINTGKYKLSKEENPRDYNPNANFYLTLKRYMMEMIREYKLG